MSKAFKLYASKDPNAIPTDADATAAARAEIRNLFVSSDQLQSRVALARIEFEKKKLHVDSQLSNLVNTQIEESRYALELLASSTRDMENTRNSFSEIDKYCEKVQALLPHYDPIKQVAIARKNLATTIGLLQLFRSIPQKAEELSDKLNDDRQLKNIYKELRRMIALRDRAFTKGMEFAGVSGMSDTVKESFDALQRVALDVEDRIWMNIRDCLVLAREDPATLVRTLEVIEMEDRASVKVFSHNLFIPQAAAQDPMEDSVAVKSARSKKGGDKAANNSIVTAKNTTASSSEVAQKAQPTMRERCFVELEHSIANQFAQTFHDRTNEDEDEDVEQQSLQEMLKSATYLMEDLQEVAECVVQCFPPEYEIFEFFDSRYQKWLSTRFVERIGDTDKVAPGDILFTINWIQEYLSRMEEMGIQVDSSSLMDQYSEDLMKSYLDQIRKTMLEWVGNICKRERNSKPIHDEESGVYTTNATQDLFLLTINQQVEIAFRSLRGKNFVSVMKICADVLSFFCDQLLEYLNDTTLPKSEEYLCAVVNTLHECAEETMKLKDRCTEHLESDNDQESATTLEDYFEQPITAFVTVSQRSAQLLRVHIINTLETVLEKAFDAEWVESDMIVEELIVTLQDFFSEYSQWLASDFHMGRIVKSVCNHLVSNYTLRMISARPWSKLGSKPEQLELVWARVESDVERLEDYFSDEQFNELVPAEIVKAEFEGIRSIQEILRAEETFLPVYFEGLIKRFGPTKAKDTFEELVSSRSDIDRASRSNLLAKFEDKTRALVNNGQATDDAESMGRSTANADGEKTHNSKSGLFSFWS